MRLALGTAQFGLSYGIANQSGQVSRAAAKAMLQLAASSGIDTLDTAITYGDSENCLGEAGITGFKVVTKLPVVPVDCQNVGEWVNEQMRASLLRLGAKAVYGLLLHRSAQLLGPNGATLYQALRALKDQGFVKKIGVSIYSPSELEALLPHYYFDLVQAPFNLVDRRLESTGWLQRLKNDGVEIHTRSVFLQGLLLMSQTDIPTQFARWDRLWETWQVWRAAHDYSALSVCLACPLAHPEIDQVVVGAVGLNELAQIVTSVQDGYVSEFPDLRCDDENLINPAKWPQRY